MRLVRYSGQFKKDYRRMEKGGGDIKKLRAVTEKLVNEEQLEAHYRDHSLQGQFARARDCHLTPDWMLIYAIVHNELRLIRIDTHSDLFK